MSAPKKKKASLSQFVVSLRDLELDGAPPGAELRAERTAHNRFELTLSVGGERVVLRFSAAVRPPTRDDDP